MGKKVYARTVTHDDVPRGEKSDADKPNRVSKIPLATLSDRVAEDNFYYLKHYFPGGLNEFRDFPNLRMVKKFYPYAKGGPLYVDEPVFEFQKEECRRKKDVMKKLGLRYIVLEDGMSKEDALSQLGVTCPTPQASQTYAP